MPASHWRNMPNLIVGGYVLELDQAKEWAEKRFPNQMEWRHDLLVDLPIDEHLQKDFNTEGDKKRHDRCIIVPWGQDSVRVCFPTVWMRNPPKNKRITFLENDFARSLKKEMFDEFSADLPYLKEIPFVTISDPYDVKGPCERSAALQNMPALHWQNMPNLIVGGYILEIDQAKEWAEKRFPNQMQWRHDLLVDLPIDEHLQKDFNTEGDKKRHDRCIVVVWQDSMRVCFPTIWMKNPPKNKRVTFLENDFARSLKKKMFEEFSADLPYLKEIPFVTIRDPYDVKGR